MTVAPPPPRRQRQDADVAPGGAGGMGVWTLAVGQTLVWASLYYVFAALTLRWETALGWSKADLAGAFSLAIVAAALAAPVAGGIIDRGHGRALMSGAALLGAAALVALSQVESLWAFYAAWLALGLSFAGCLYEPCFAYLTRRLGPRARSAITRITLIAGLASSLSFPLAAVLAEAYGWRAALWVFAGLAALGGAMLWTGAGWLDAQAKADAPSTDPAARRAADRIALRAALRRPTFWLIACAFATMALNHGMVVTHLLAILDAKGATPAAAVAAAAAIGPMQVAGRIGMMTLGADASSLTLTVASFASVAVAALALAVSGAAPLFIALFAVAQGAGYGLTSILRPVVAAELLGRDGFGAISGRMATLYLAASAAAPLLGAVMWGIGGADAAIAVAFASAALGLAAFATAALAARRHPQEAAS